MSDEGSRQAPRKKKVRRQRRERGRLHLYQHSSGIWYMRGTVADTQVHESTKTHSEDHAKRIRDDRERELLDAKVYGKEVVATFKDAVEAYKKSKGDAQKKYLEWLSPRFDAVKLKDIDATAIYEFADEKFPEATNSSKNTLVVNPMRTILRYAATQKLCHVPAIPSLEDDSEEVRGLPDEWVRRFLSECGDRELVALVALMTTTGCRCAEALKIEKEMVSADGTEIVMPARITKTDRPRKLALTGAVSKLISDVLTDRARIFHWHSTNAVNSRLAYWCRKLGLEQASTHRLGRHSFAERWLASGGDLLSLMNAGGWTSYSSVQRYAHLEQKAVHDKTRELGAELFKPKLKIVGGN